MQENWLSHVFLFYNFTKVCYRYITHYISFIKKQVATSCHQVQKLELNNNHLTLKILQ